MGVNFPRLKINETPFMSSLYHYKTAQKKLDDSDVWNTLEIQVFEIPVLITKGQEYDGGAKFQKCRESTPGCMGPLSNCLFRLIVVK